MLKKIFVTINFKDRSNEAIAASTLMVSQSGSLVVVVGADDQRNFVKDSWDTLTIRNIAEKLQPLVT